MWCSYIKYFALNSCFESMDIKLSLVCQNQQDYEMKLINKVL